MPITYNFSREKNSELTKKRRVSFEEVISAIENNSIISVIEHPNAQKYPDQQIYILELNQYVYLVPFIIQKDGDIFLKTIIPSRKATKKYLTEVKDE